MYRNKKISVVLPCYNERQNISHAIRAFFEEPSVDEVVVADNNSTDGSAEEIQKTRALYVHAAEQGYGAALRIGMARATGDIIITVEPDGTFRASDIERLLIYGRDYDVVLGTRTSRSPVWSGGDPGANMDFSLRMGNWVVAKMLEYLFNAPSLTDVGCTYKLIHRQAYNTIKGSFTVTGNWFSPEFMIRVLQHGFSLVEIPVHYGTRIGTSKITGKRGKAIRLGLRMIRFILTERIRSWR